MFRYIAFILIVFITIALCLWPDLHPERMVVSEHRWYIDLITHGGYYFVATTLLLALKLKPGIYKVATAFFVLSLALEFLQYYSFNRSVDPVDMTFNLVGIVGAVGFVKVVRRVGRWKGGKLESWKVRKVGRWKVRKVES